MFKSKLRLAGLVVALVLLFAVLVLILLHTPPARRYALRQIQTRLAALDIRLDASQLHYNLPRGSATLTDVRLSSVIKPDLPAFAEVGEMTVKAGLLSLVRGMISVDEARLNDVKLHWLTTEAGRTNLPDIPEQKVEEEEGGLPEFLISSLRINHLSILLDDRQRQIRAELPDATLEVAGRMPDFNHDIELNLSKAGRVQIENRSISLDDLDLKAQLAGNLSGLTVSGLRLRSGDSTLRLAGRLEGLADPSLDFSAEVHLDLAQVTAAAKLAEPVAGSLRVEADIKGPAESLIVEGRLQGERLAFRRFSDLFAGAAFGWDQEAGQLRIASLALRSPFGSLTGESDVALSDSGGTSRADLELQGVDLKLLMNAAGSPVSLASRAAGRVRAEWQGSDIRTATGQADISLAATGDRASRNTLPLSGELTAKLPRPGFAAVSLREVHVPGFRASGDLTLAGFHNFDAAARSDIRGRIAGDVTDLGLLAANLEAFTGTPEESSVRNLRLRGGAALASSVTGTLDRPVLAVTLAAPSLGVAEFEGIRVEAESEIDSDEIRVNKAVAEWKGQSATVQGSVGFQPESPVLNLNGTISRVDIPQVLAALGRDIPITGQVQATASVQGTVAHPEAQFSAQVQGIEVYQEPLGKLTVEGTLADQLIEVKQMVLEKGAPETGTLAATGSYQLDSGAYRIDLKSHDLKLSQLSLPGSVPLAGQISISAHGSGTVEDPRLTVTLQAEELKVRDRALGSVRAEGQVEHREARLSMTAPAFNLTANGRIGIDAPYSSDVTVRADSLQLSALPFLVADKPLEGQITAELTAQANALDPMEGEARLSVSDLSLLVAGQSIESQRPFEIDYANHRVGVSPATIESGGSYLTLEGELPVDWASLGAPWGTPALPGTHPLPGTPGLSLKGSLDLGQLAHIFLPSRAYSGTGSLNVDGRVTGAIPNVDPALRLSLQGGTLRLPALAAPVEQIDLNLSLANGAVALDRLSARLGPGTLDVTGKLPLGVLPLELPETIAKAEGPADLRGTLSSFSLQSISGLPEDVTGSLTASFEAQTPTTDPDSLVASLRLDTLSLRVAGISLEQEIPGFLTLQHGQVRVERFALIGPETRIEAGGTAAITETRALDLRAGGKMDLSLLAVLTKDVAAAGASEFQVALGGTTSDLRASGFWSLENGQLTVEEPGLQLTDLGVRLDLIGNRVVVRKFNGNLNGGSLQVSGEAGFAAGALASLDLRATGRGVYLELPEGLQTSSNADLRLVTQGGPIELGGRVEVLQGSYTDPVNLEEELLGLVTSETGSGVAGEQDPLLSRLRFNVNVASRDPIVMDNNLAKMAGELDVRLVGNYYRPSLLGRLTLEEGGELYLRERTYYLERGIISFYNPTRIEPSLDLAAKTQVDEYEITLRISGDPENLQTNLTSEDPLPEPDIIALLVTGRKLEEARGEASAVLREQTLSLLTGTVTGRLERGLEEATGLSKVRIQPSLIAAESDPTARLTIGQDLTRQLGLIYSMDLTNGSDQIYIGEYDVTRRFTARVIHETAPEGGLDADAKYRFEVRHDLRIGGDSNTGATAAGEGMKREVSGVKLEGGLPFSEKELLKQFGIKPGDRYDFFKVRRGLARLNDFLEAQGYLEARVRLSREEPSAETTELSLQVEPGPRVEFDFQGAELSEDVRRKVRQAWAEGVFDAQRAASAEEVIRTQFVQDGFLEARISHEVRPAGEGQAKQVVLTVEPGARYASIEIAFQGVTAIPEERLREELRNAELLGRIQAGQSQVKDLLKRVYRQEGFLQTDVGDPVAELHSETGEARIVLPVIEGPRAVITEVQFEGNSVFRYEDLLTGSGLTAGQVFQPRLPDDAVGRLQDMYSNAGYNDIAIEADVEAPPETGRVRLAFRIEENRKEVVRDVGVEGNRKTSEAFIRNQVTLAPGDPLTPERVARSRRNLYNTGAYTLVEIDREEIEKAAPAGEKPVRAIVRVREVPPYRLQYGGFYDTDRGLGVIADATNRNIIGNAATLGLRGRYDDQFREIRAFYSQPQLAGLPFDTSIATFLSREVRQEASFAVDRAGFSLQQHKEFRNRFVVSYGYRFERDHTYDIGPDAFFDVTLKVGRLLASAVRDVRDDILDASRGSFISQSVEFAPKWVGSDLTFGRYFGQYFHYIPLSEPTEIPWSGGVRKSRLVYAGGVRLGLAQAFGEQIVVPSERFFAGGGTSVRGFEPDTIGPRNIIGDPSGGEAVLILNNELRFPLYGIFDGVGFVDVGNVYREIRDFDPFDVRSSAGFGLRIRTPYFLLRADYGLKLDRQPDEKRGAFFFSIGQAF